MFAKFSTLYGCGIQLKAIEWYGRNSLIVMCTHYSIMTPFISFIVEKIVGVGQAICYPYDILVVLIIVLLEIPLCAIINTYTPLLAGK